MGSIGSWMSPSVRMTAASGIGRLRATWLSCASSPSTSSVTAEQPRSACGRVASRLPGMMSTCCLYWLDDFMRRPWVLFSPAEMAKPGFKAADDSLRWALSGFANPTVWLVFTAFMFGLGYEKTGLGRHIALMLVRSLGRSTLRLGYAVTLTDAILAPFTPSNTARSAGTIFPVVRNLPPLYGSMPNEPSARDVGSYIMWTTFAAGCITSSLFLTALAPNLLAVEFIRKIANVEITWAEWFFAAAPFALPLLLILPVLTYALYPPRIKHSAEVPAWAVAELKRLGPLSRREVILALLVMLAVLMWIFGGHYVEA